MIARPRQRRSRAAFWSSRLALTALVVLVAGALLHRTDAIGTPLLFIVMAVGFTMAAIAIAVAIAAMISIWRDGRIGFGAACRGLLVGAALLAVPAIAAVDVLRYPRLAEVTTDIVDPPSFSPSPDRRGPIGARALALQAEAYPDLVPHRYPLGSRRLFEAVRGQVAERGWQVVDLTVPADDQAGGRIEAVARTPLFAFREDVVLRVLPDEGGARLDMRSASRYGDHDFGGNAARVRSFMTDLDAALAGAEP